MHVRPYKAVRQLRDSSNGRYAVAAKTVALASLLGHIHLDQVDRPRRKPTRNGAKRVIRTQFARRARFVALAHLHDRARRKNPSSVLSRKLLNCVSRIGGLAAIANALPSDELVGRFKLVQKEVKYVVSIVEYLLKSRAYPEASVPSSIEDAKAFVWLEAGEYGTTKIGQIWEDYKLVAPYLYALHLEKTFQPSKIERVDDALSWLVSFAKSRRRLDRFLGHAAFVMDALNSVARDQRERDFADVSRVRPPLHPFNVEDKEILPASID